MALPSIFDVPRMAYWPLTAVPSCVRSIKPEIGQPEAGERCPACPLGAFGSGRQPFQSPRRPLRIWKLPVKALPGLVEREPAVALGLAFGVFKRQHIVFDSSFQGKLAAHGRKCRSPRCPSARA